MVKINQYMVVSINITFKTVIKALGEGDDVFEKLLEVNSGLVSL